MDLPVIADRMARRFGDRVRPWTADLPDRLSRIADDWGLRLGEVFPDGNSAVALRAERDGVAVVLKVSPDVLFAAEQAEILRGLAPSGRVPAVLAEDPSEGAVLLEFVDGTVGWPSPQRFGALLSALHAAVAEPRALSRADLWEVPDLFKARLGPLGPVTPDDLRVAWERSKRMLAGQGDPVLLHGDLHVHNLLDAGPDRGLVVIDPQGTLGEPEFDAVDYVLAGPDIPTRRDALLAVTTLDPIRLDGWCRAMAPYVAVSATRLGKPTDELLAYARE